MITEADTLPGPLARQRLGGLRAVCIDIETNPADHDRIFKIGLVRSDSGEGLTLAVGRTPTPELSQRLDAFAQGCELLVGHNLRRHDAVHLRRQLPGLQLLELPMIDTLEWSALAFPNNPYHRLIKGYKLLSDARNDPERDARAALELLADEQQAFADFQAQDPDWLAILHGLMADDAPLQALLARIRGLPPPDAAQTVQRIRSRLGALVCGTGLEALLQPMAMAEPAFRQSLAYGLGWVRVAGGNSVLPLWVHHALPEARLRIHQLREQDCGRPGCAYCQLQHNPERLLERHFQKDRFRARPAHADGSSMQRAIVQAGLAGRSLLAVLPTGGGKSIAYQLPALVHYERAGRLTVIISPLQSLMKDQLDNLLAAGVSCAVAISGLLTPLERRAALDKLRLGDAGIVLVSPEQFRSRSFTEALTHREIACWVFDEAHCLSKWGHDFRTDYLYVSRFIREHMNARPAPVACFTATAKPDVIEDLRQHFLQGLGIELEPFLGGHQRDNLSYTVFPTPRPDKAARIVEILKEELKDGGAAVVFCARRRDAEETAEFLKTAGWAAGCFHGGLVADEKKSIQNSFLNGELNVIAATNAFGMGVDKPDIRVVIHADIPGSLENYLQEAGRAGRDGQAARCVLLFDAQDVETQFRMGSVSQLTPKDFSALLRAIRQRARRLRSDEIVVSAKELLLDSEGANIDIERPDATTKVTTAVAWLERAGFLQRDENATRVFPASLRVASLPQALARIDAAELPAQRRRQFVAVVTSLFQNQDPEGISTDELMLDAGIEPADCFRILHQLEQLGILANDLGLSVRLSKGVPRPADKRLTELDRLERTLLEILSEAAPDAEVGDEAMHLSIPAVCTEIRLRLDPDRHDAAPTDAVNPQTLRDCLGALAESFGSGSEKRSMLSLRSAGRDALRVSLLRPWSQIRAICERRRAAAAVVLHRLLAEVREGARGGNHVVECKARDLLRAIEDDLDLAQTLKEPAIAMEHSLLYLDRNRVLELDKGRSVFRPAMTLRLQAAARRRRFAREDFEPLKEFYRERTLQTHVMHEYAKLGASDGAAAQRLVDAYFSWPRKTFVREFFRGRSDLLELATTEESFRRIVDQLGHPVQEALVEKPEVGNHLVLAGPGSGKTRVIVHRIAYLVRVRRVAPAHIIALAFNRSAALQLRRRLADLIGEEARGVAVLTYHAMALRLTGTSLAAADLHSTEIDFEQMIRDAIRLLEGHGEGLSEADELRDRLLQGYEYIFVDEYQDIDALQYALVSALAGRRRADPDARLSIMAVGDDDQNIYSFKGASVEFIRRFQEDYGGELTYLVENFRSTQHIITAAGHVIQGDPGRMKVDHPIRIDARRLEEPAGGPWAQRDPLGQGRVKLLTTAADANRQAQVAGAEIEQLLQADPTLQPGRIAVLARTHRTLEPLRALLELRGWRCELQTREEAAGRVPLMRSRQGVVLARLLRRRHDRLLRLDAAARWLRQRQRAEPLDPFWEELSRALDDQLASSEGRRMSGALLLDALYESAAELRRDGTPQAIKLMSAHGAKGLEFDHVLIMDCRDWQGTGADERRLLYVAMTRARRTLTLLQPATGHNPHLAELDTLDAVLARQVPPPPRRPELDRRWLPLGPADVDLGWAGRHAPDDPLHARLQQLAVGAEVWLADRLIVDAQGQALGRLATRTQIEGRLLRAQVSGLMVRSRQQTAEPYLAALRCDQWLVPLLTLVLAPTRDEPTG